MKERPILFSAPMVRAILDGRKTQTRRIINFKKIAKQSGCTKGTLAYSVTFRSWAVYGGNGGTDLCLVNCPYGQIGDRLWVREAFSIYRHPTEPVVHYKADDPKDQYLKYKPSIHMPRWASRITLEIVKVRVERLQDISEEDAMAEGVVQPNFMKLPYRDLYCELWEEINGKGSWDLNPWVWAIEFERCDK